jgi:hypothetical protein
MHFETRYATIGRGEIVVIKKEASLFKRIFYSEFFKSSFEVDVEGWVAAAAGMEVHSHCPLRESKHITPCLAP